MLLFLVPGSVANGFCCTPSLRRVPSGWIEESFEASVVISEYNDRELAKNSTPDNPLVNYHLLKCSLSWYSVRNSWESCPGEVVVDKTFGNRLRRFRQERKITMEQLAEAVGVSKSYIWALENNPEQRAQRTSATVMNSLAKALEINLLDLMGEAPPESLGDEAQPEDVMFFRNYMGMTGEDRETYRQMLELFRKTKDK